MKITIIGRGAVGVVWLACSNRLATKSRHSDADVVMVAVPGNAIEDAIGKVQGVEGKTVLDATNPLEGRPDGVDSLAQQVKSLTHGPVAKAFSSNFERLYGDVSRAGNRPSALYCGDDEAREVAELNRDAGCEPIYAGGLENAREGPFTRSPRPPSSVASEARALTGLSACHDVRFAFRIADLRRRRVA